MRTPKVTLRQVRAIEGAFGVPKQRNMAMRGRFGCKWEKIWKNSRRLRRGSWHFSLCTVLTEKCCTEDRTKKYCGSAVYSNYNVSAFRVFPRFPFLSSSSFLHMNVCNNDKQFGLVDIFRRSLVWKMGAGSEQKIWNAVTFSFHRPTSTFFRNTCRNIGTAPKRKTPTGAIGVCSIFDGKFVFCLWDLRYKTIC